MANTPAAPATLESHPLRGAGLEPLWPIIDSVIAINAGRRLHQPDRTGRPECRRTSTASKQATAGAALTRVIEHTTSHIVRNLPGAPQQVPRPPVGRHQSTPPGRFLPDPWTRCLFFSAAGAPSDSRPLHPERLRRRTLAGVASLAAILNRTTSTAVRDRQTRRGGA